MKTQSLLNNEGDNLTLKKLDPDQFQILDQNGQVIANYTLVQLCDWIQGKTTIIAPPIDNEDEINEWHYPSSAGDKPSLHKLFSYIFKW